MPELPEVETVVRDLRPLLVGRLLSAVWAGSHRLRRPWQPEWAPTLTGARVAGIGRRGKWILIELKKPSPQPPPLRGEGEQEGALSCSPSPLRGGGWGEGFLVVHLGMTGQLTVAPAAEPRKDHTHLVFDLDDGTHQLRFRDIRRFGSAELFPDAAAVDAFLAGRLGPEPFALDPAGFRAAVQKSARPLKAILLDQTVVAGVGNIYADEALHRSGLHPQTRGTAVSAAAADRLREAITTVLSFAIECRGSSIRDYVGGSGLRGGFQAEFRVYGRTGDPCPGCAAPIELVRVAGRASHYCPSCQSFYHKDTKDTKKAKSRVRKS